MRKWILGILLGFVLGTLVSVSTAKWVGEDVYHHFGQRLVKAICLLVKDEINILRVNAGLSERTNIQILNALETKYNETSDDIGPDEL